MMHLGSKDKIKQATSAVVAEAQRKRKICSHGELEKEGGGHSSLVWWVFSATKIRAAGIQSDEALAKLFQTIHSALKDCYKEERRKEGQEEEVGIDLSGNILLFEDENKKAKVEFLNILRGSKGMIPLKGLNLRNTDVEAATLKDMCKVLRENFDFEQIFLDDRENDKVYRKYATEINRLCQENLELRRVLRGRYHRVELRNRTLSMVMKQLLFQPLCANMTVLNLNYNLIKLLPPSIGQLSNLRELRFAHNHISVVPEQISQLTNLQLLDLRYNKIDYLPKSIGSPQMKQLAILKLKGNAPIAKARILSDSGDISVADMWGHHQGHLETTKDELRLDGTYTALPLDIMSHPSDRNGGMVLAWLREVYKGSRKRPRFKLVVIGPRQSGKSSLINLLFSEEKRINPGDDYQKPTYGIHRTWYEVERGQGDVPITICVYECNADKLSTEFVITPWSMYVLVFNIAHAEKELPRLDHWLRTIEQRLPQAMLPVMLVGTHDDLPDIPADTKKEVWLKMKMMQSKYHPKLRHIAIVSAFVPPSTKALDEEEKDETGEDEGEEKEKGKAAVGTKLLRKVMQRVKTMDLSGTKNSVAKLRLNMLWLADRYPWFHLDIPTGYLHMEIYAASKAFAYHPPVMHLRSFLSNACRERWDLAHTHPGLHFLSCIGVLIHLSPSPWVVLAPYYLSQLLNELPVELVAREKREQRKGPMNPGAKVERCKDDLERLIQSNEQSASSVSGSSLSSPSSSSCSSFISSTSSSSSKSSSSASSLSEYRRRGTLYLVGKAKRPKTMAESRLQLTLLQTEVQRLEQEFRFMLGLMGCADETEEEGAENGEEKGRRGKAVYRDSRWIASNDLVIPLDVWNL
ncbi:Malignant fibrous histiocytoma-amplified sequence 1 [Balamuthia mandrillaris]